MKNKKMVWAVVIIVIIVGGLSFYGGMKYESSKHTTSVAGAFNRGAGAGGFIRGAGGAGAGLITGQVIAVDATSITVQTRDGSSKIVFFTTATPVSEMVAGKTSDITVGKQINIVGTTNSDGSITATQVQLRPAMTQGQGQTPIQSN